MSNCLINYRASQVIPDLFPTDFSILAVIRSRQTFSRVPVFSIYTSESEESLVLFVGSEIALVYQDLENSLGDETMISFEADTNDLEWHRIGLSVKGDSVTLIFDCGKQITKRLPRSLTSRVMTDGLIFMGVQLDEEEEYFLGDIQLLMIADKPDAAYELCTKYAPNCAGSSQSSSRQSSSSSFSSSNRGSSSGSSQGSSSGSSQGSISGSSGSSGSSQGSSSGSRASSSRNASSRSSGRNSGGAQGSRRVVTSSFHADSAAGGSHDNSAEMDGLDLGFHSEDDYYDSLNSESENGAFEIPPNGNDNGIRNQVQPTQRPPNPEYDLAAINEDGRVGEHDEDEVTEINESAATVNVSFPSFSTVVNGVKLKSLPGPRGGCFKGIRNYFKASSCRDPRNKGRKRRTG